MEMPKLAPGHSFFERMAGQWSGDVKMYPSPWDPKGGTAPASTRIQVQLNGFVAIGDYDQKKDGVTAYAGHSVFTYDAENDLYTLHWFDSIGSPPEVFTGKRVGQVLTLAHGGPGMHARLTYDLTDQAELKSSMEMSQDGAHWQKFLDVSYRKS